MKLNPYATKSILLILLLLSQNSFGKIDSEKLFKENCGSCHEIGRILTGPDLQNINSLRTKEWLIRFITDSKKLINEENQLALQVYEEYQKIEMPPSDLDSNEILAILDYIEKYEYIKPISKSIDVVQTSKKSFPISTVSLISISILLILLIIVFLSADLRKRIPISFYVFTTLLILIFLSLNARSFQDNRVAKSLSEIKQDVDFNHKIHYNDYTIDCIYCHDKALNYPQANLPLISNCMKCHHYIQEGEVFGKDEISKLTELDSIKKGINWKKGYRLPEHVHFNHGLHVKTAKLSCIDCHDQTDQPMISKSLVQMKWCIRCHNEQYINLELNYYKNVYDTIYNLTGLSVTKNGGANCSVCHY